MHLHALATAVPPDAFTQQECWDVIHRSPAFAALQRRSRLMLQAILRSESGVHRRHFALADPERIFGLGADELNEAFRREAPALASRALAAALAPAGATPADLDALFICTCTGYLCPGVTSYVAEQLGLRRDAFLLDIVGHGCGAAIPTLHSASTYLAAHPGALVATVAVEVCSAAFYLDDDPGVLVSACIFGDGAAAAVWRDEPGPTGLECGGFATHHVPEDRDRLRFEQRGGKLRNLLDPAVPGLAAKAVAALRPAGPLPRPVVHPGGREVIAAVETVLGAPLPASREVLAAYGNMSSPSVLFVLEHELRRATTPPADGWWLASFGAGFSAHGCRLAPGARTENMRKESAIVANSS
ncbi:MAG TPA: stilbene synthase [Lacunisphaera sp.]|jgi:alkylresorcinol/alkylpyrone synthase|nr:stilbene synthase [Lacunisphaera sp.]